MKKNIPTVLAVIAALAITGIALGASNAGEEVRTLMPAELAQTLGDGQTRPLSEDSAYEDMLKTELTSEKSDKYLYLFESGSGELKNFRTTVDCVPYYLDIKNVDLFARHRVYSEIELAARYKMKLDNYCKVIRIEAQTMQEMVWQDILPAASAYSKKLSDTALSKAQLGIDNSFEKEQAAKVSELMSETVTNVKALAAAAESADEYSENYTRASVFRDKVLPAQEALRRSVDGLEQNTAKQFWPYPTYGDILFSVQ